ncbi:MAG: hypothetical protein NC432_12415 [Roseburia sp.]|nr:hypothetical protein [Roseburia sp.]MCM1096479.1 hypothetical protein [Ruminococcus flavefaciens]
MNTRYWKRFENSGKIEDYLAFLACERSEGEGGEKAGEGQNAGIYYGDGDRAEAVSRGGVRQTYQPFDEGEG